MSRTYPERPIVGVGVVVWREQRILLIRRGMPPRQGQWSLPGGAQKLGESLIEAATREVFEETSLRLIEPQLITALDLIDRDGEGKVRYHYTLVDYTGEAPEGRARAGDDAAHLDWFTLAEIDELPLWNETKRIIRMAASIRRDHQP